MPMTVITLTNVPPALRGDLTKWMQEISVGVYVGNFNSRIRTNLWKRIIQNVGKGQATISYTSKNELGYCFETHNSFRKLLDLEGIPLVWIPKQDNSKLPEGFSAAAHFRKIKRISSKKVTTKNHIARPYVVLDIETDGLDENINSIIEIGALKVVGTNLYTFHNLIQYKGKLPENIIKLTGIDDDLLKEKGHSLLVSLKELINFVGNDILVGYNINFDINFLNRSLTDNDMPIIDNDHIDLLKLVKRENMFMDNYKLENVLSFYEINSKIHHRALEDAKLTNDLTKKLKTFSRVLSKKNNQTK